MGCSNTKVSDSVNNKAAIPIHGAPAAAPKNSVKEAEDKQEQEKIKARAPRQRRVSVSAEADKDTSVFVPKVFPKDEEAMKRIEKSVRNNLLFGALDDAQRKMVIEAMEEKKCTEGQKIINQGEQGDYFYVVDSGVYSVTLKNVNDGKPVLHYEAGNAFGELALMYNCPRAATVTCDIGGVLWALDRNTFKHVVINSMSGKRQKYEVFLTGVDILKNLTQEERSKLADVIESLDFKDGEIIIREGEANYDKMKLYFIEEGEAVAHAKDEGGNDKIVGEMKVSDYFGEKALIQKAPRAATVSAKGKLVCAVIDVAAFERLLGPCRDIMVRRFETYEKRRSLSFAKP